MNAHPHTGDLSAFALGALDVEEAHLVRVHLAACPRCRATVKAYYTGVSVALRGTAPESASTLAVAASRQSRYQRII